MENLRGGTLVAVLVYSAACRSTPLERAAPGQPTMNELMHRRAAKNNEEMAQWKAMDAEVRSMSPERVRTLIDEVKLRPDDQALSYRLILYFQLHADVGPRSQLALWYFANHPNGRVAPETIHPAWSRVAWEQGAARYLPGKDKPEAERVLLMAKEKYPNDHWEAPLGQLYALAILGAVGPLMKTNAIRESSEEEAHSEFANRVRAKLEASKDVGLLASTAHWLMSWARRDRNGNFPSIDLATSLVERGGWPIRAIDGLIA